MRGVTECPNRNVIANFHVAGSRGKRPQNNSRPELNIMADIGQGVDQIDEFSAAFYYRGIVFNFLSRVSNGSNENVAVFNPVIVNRANYPRCIFITIKGLTPVVKKTLDFQTRTLRYGLRRPDECPPTQPSRPH